MPVIEIRTLRISNVLNLCYSQSDHDASNGLGETDFLSVPRYGQDGNIILYTLMLYKFAVREPRCIPSVPFRGSFG